MLIVNIFDCKDEIGINGNENKDATKQIKRKSVRIVSGNQNFEVISKLYKKNSYLRERQIDREKESLTQFVRF